MALACLQGSYIEHVKKNWISAQRSDKNGSHSKSTVSRHKLN
jgi:hypothetical protein